MICWNSKIKKYYIFANCKLSAHTCISSCLWVNLKKYPISTTSKITKGKSLQTWQHTNLLGCFVINSLRPSETYICVGKLTITGSDNGLSPGCCQAIIWTNAGILSIGPFGINFRELLIKIYTFHSRKCIWKCCLVNGGYFVSASMH